MASEAMCGCEGEPHTCEQESDTLQIMRLVRELDETRAELATMRMEFAGLEHGAAIVRAENVRLRALINTPRTDEFFEAVRIEAAHQIERWGVEHDAGKRPEDWVTLITYLLGKASKAHFEGNRDKLLHHVITLAAVSLNWHRNMTGENTAMRPGIGPRP